MPITAKGITSGVTGLVVVKINCFLQTFVNKSLVINPISAGLHCTARVSHVQLVACVLLVFQSGDVRQYYLIVGKGHQREWREEDPRYPALNPHRREIWRLATPSVQCIVK